MAQTISELLKRHRAHRVPWYRRWSILGSLLLHLGVAAAAIVAPLLLVKKAPPPEFVSIQIVPAAALGQLAPPPPPAEQAEKAPPPLPRAPAARQTPASVRRRSSTQSRPTEPTSRQAPPPAELPTTPTEPATQDQPPRRLGSPRGNSLATGSGSEISGFDDPDFTYGYYADLMLSRIRAHWERPPLGGEVEMVVHYRILKDGRVRDLKILRSSGYNSFDRAGLLAIRRATMPPLPKGYRSSSLGVRLIIR